jgi:hypothetical protein
MTTSGPNAEASTPVAQGDTNAKFQDLIGEPYVVIESI